MQSFCRVSDVCVLEQNLQCFFDTPGLMLKKSGYGYKDIKARVQNAWTSVDLFDVLIVMFDVHRHLTWLVTLQIFFLINLSPN